MPTRRPISPGRGFAQSAGSFASVPPLTESACLAEILRMRAKERSQVGSDQVWLVEGPAPRHERSLRTDALCAQSL